MVTHISTELRCIVLVVGLAVLGDERVGVNAGEPHADRAVLGVDLPGKVAASDPGRIRLGVVNLDLGRVINDIMVANDVVPAEGGDGRGPGGVLVDLVEVRFPTSRVVESALVEVIASRDDKLASRTLAGLVHGQGSKLLVLTSSKVFVGCKAVLGVGAPADKASREQGGRHRPWKSLTSQSGRSLPGRQGW